jgi:toxin ParE1/3/4
VAYRLTEAATGDLDALYLHGILTYGLKQADSYYDGLIEKFPMIADHPSWGSDYVHVLPNIRRYEYKAHAIYYQASASGILIVRVLGGKQDPGRHL